MASSSSFILLVTILFVLAVISHARGCYTSIFSFGDSLADTGNSLHLTEVDKTPHYGFPPNGDSYFRRPTGRCCDGRLVIDFIAEYFGVPLLPPYFPYRNNGSGHGFRKGVNFAVVGATALDVAFFEERGIHDPSKNSSLGTQMGFFKEMLSSLCFTYSDCKAILQNSLVVMGEIGGNDYNHPFLAGKSIEEVRGFVPLVVNAIGSAIKDLIELGVGTVLVPGHLPVGCMPSFLSYFQNSDKEDYDPLTGCLKWINKFVEYHNEQLQMELNRIRELYPHAKIFYANYYNAAMLLFQSPKQYGFTGEALMTCCGGGGPYNYNATERCGTALARPCPDPSTYINWDGLHFTERANKLITKSFLEGPYTIPPMNVSCNSLLMDDMFPMSEWMIQ